MSIFLEFQAKKAIDDEEFEEFPVQEWAERSDDADDEEMNVWEDNWDDETHESDFSKQLKYVMFFLLFFSFLAGFLISQFYFFFSKK